MKYHIEVLPEQQREVLRIVGPAASSRGFYLGGGTAVALYLGHRESVDFDWFTADTILDPHVLAKQLEDDGVNMTIDQVAPGTLHGYLLNTRLSFLEYHYPLLRPTNIWKDYGCVMPSLDDLACMKLAAVAGRGARRDFIDLYMLCRLHISLPDILRSYQAKYNTQDIGHVLYALAYFDDAEHDPMPKTGNISSLIRRRARFSRSTRVTRNCQPTWQSHRQRYSGFSKSPPYLAGGKDK